MTLDISNFIKKCVICTTNKLAKKFKPNNKQIISYFPLERVELDLTYLNKIYLHNKSKYNYLLCIIDHFSKYAKAFLMETKEAKEVLKYLKIYIDIIGIPKIIQSDNGNEFTAKIIKDYLKEKNIIFINSGIHHPQTNRVVEAFNKNIINKLEYILLDDNKKFDIKLGINKAEEIYNNIIHSTIKVEPVKAFNLTDEEDINNVISNVLKSQKKFVNNFNIIKKGEKCLLKDLYIKKGKVLKIKFNKIGKYRITIIIEEALDGTTYNFKVSNNICDLSVYNLYKEDYRLINIEVWEYLNNEINK